MIKFIKSLVRKVKPKKLYRSSATGKFVSEAFAKANPDTTYAVSAKKASGHEQATGTKRA